MPENTLWQGSPSQWTNLGWFAACLLVLPIPVAIFKAMQTRGRRFTLTSERLLDESGVFTKRIDHLELYRVKDLAIELPFALRMVGCGNIILTTSDQTTPRVVLPAIADPREVLDLIRSQVESERDRKRVTEVDMT